MPGLDDVLEGFHVLKDKLDHVRVHVDLAVNLFSVVAFIDLHQDADWELATAGAEYLLECLSG
jgi:hypothetical protein